jgi:hypothetical protein
LHPCAAGYAATRAHLRKSWSFAIYSEGNCGSALTTDANPFVNSGPGGLLAGDQVSPDSFDPRTDVA